jgi:anti-sigma factor (TIGR02949 family)
MNCEEASILLHALIDSEIDAGHARDVEAHIATCPSCAAQLREFQEFRKAMTAASLRYTAPASLRSRIEGKLPATRATGKPFRH